MAAKYFPGNCHVNCQYVPHGRKPVNGLRDGNGLIVKILLVRWLAVRKKLVLFTRLFINPKTDGALYQSVRWQYAANGKNTIIDLYPNGLVGDTAGMGMKLSQYFGENLLKYEETDSKARYILGNPLNVMMG